ncbi:MAG TPA: response regulator [Clostridia bacterium]|nr:response regulator [Clostridia bacterium]
MSTRILIADDEGINRLFIKTILTSNGWIVDEASNGQAAIELVEKHEFDIIILDVKMPVMDGKRAAAEIRSLEREQGRISTAILGLTAYAETELVEELVQHGMNGVIHKPITEKALIGKINAMLDSD